MHWLELSDQSKSLRNIDRSLRGDDSSDDFEEDDEDDVGNKILRFMKIALIAVCILLVVVIICKL